MIALIKHIDIRAHWLREAVFNNAIVMQHIKTELQIADVLTKYLSMPVFVCHKKSMLEGVQGHGIIRKASVLVSYLGGQNCNKLLQFGELFCDDTSMISYNDYEHDIMNMFGLS